MSQIFHHSANTLARMSIIVVGMVVVFGGWAWREIVGSDYATGANEHREQPVPFSHAHHVGGLGVDCLYCHTSVEDSKFANVPPTKTCMNCHAQVWSTSSTLEPVRESYRTGQSIQWTRVYDLPDFVYFNHSIHVAKGVGCETCHGRVDKMPLIEQATSLRMQWCLDCHRAPEMSLRPREFVTTMGYQPQGSQEEIGRRLVQEYKVRDARTLTSCSTCHR